MEVFSNGTKLHARVEGPDAFARAVLEFLSDVDRR
jgi:hypothetical protein